MEKSMELLDILSRESTEPQELYLYEENGRWYAYEHSAVMIKKLFGSMVSLKQVINELYDVVLRKAEIKDLVYLIKNSVVVSCSDNELVMIINQ